jgi:diguanylate cyclase (GGDEF)-like protein
VGFTGAKGKGLYSFRTRLSRSPAEPSAVNLLLHHVDLITRSRNRGEIEAALITAVRTLLQARRTELHKVFMPPGDVLVGLAAEIAPETGGQAVTHDDGFSWPEQIGSIEHTPHFQSCLTDGRTRTDELADGDSRTILLIRNAQHEPYAFLSILRPQPLTADELQTAEGFVQLLVNSLAMLDYSETDSLTRLLNRKTFDEYLIKILTHIPVQNDALSGALHLPQRRLSHPDARDHWLGVMDIDHFKSINDRFGHLIGDEVLILMANLMRESFRVQDKLFRFGGEEFVALLRPAEFSHAIGTFQRFRSQVESHEFPQVGHVTVSIGFTRIKLGDTLSMILDSADEALYWAKEHGRNQCHAFETLVADGKLKARRAPESELVLF